MKYLLLTMLLFLGAAQADEIPDIKTIIEKANIASSYAGDDGRSDARMMIYDAAGNRQMRQFVVLRKDEADGGDQNYLVVFSRPTDVKDTVFLVHKKVNDEDDRWLYLPALDLEKRISATDNRTSFVGSDFYYEDVSGRSPAADEHELISSEGDVFKIKSTPKEPSLVEFAYYKMEIDKNTFMPMLIEYYDGKDEIIRRIEVVEMVDVDGYPTVLKSKVSNLKTGGYTLMEFRRPAYNVGIDDDVFTVRSLRRPPQQWLK